MNNTILIVEDNLLNMELLIEMLNALGDWETITACDGQEGIIKAQTLNPQLILLDIQLPGLDGFEIIHQLHLSPSTANIPVVGVTAYASKEDEQRILNAGFNGYLSKPINLNNLKSILKMIFNHV